jgi:hypothetical protein
VQKLSAENWPVFKELHLHMFNKNDGSLMWKENSNLENSITDPSQLGQRSRSSGIQNRGVLTG